MNFVYYTEWNQLPESANALFEQAEKENVFFSRSWFESLASTELDDEQSMLLACVVAGSKVKAILPLIKGAGGVGYSLKHRYTPRYSLLLADNELKQHQQQILTCLVEGLSEVSLNALLLEPVAEDDSNLNSLQRAMETAGFKCERSFRFYNWILRVQGQSFADYMAARPANLRNTISRKTRKLKREHDYDIRLFTGDEVPRNMSDYYAVYSASWKANEQFEGLVDDMVAGFSKAGWTRLGIIYIKGKPAAAQLWFVNHGKASIFRLSYDEAWKKYSLGSILTSFLMEHVIDIDKVEEVDFLTGNDTYKQDWMSQRKERFILSCVKNVKIIGKYEKYISSLKELLSRY